MDGWMDKARR